MYQGEKMRVTGMEIAEEWVNGFSKELLSGRELEITFLMVGGGAKGPIKIVPHGSGRARSQRPRWRAPNTVAGK